MQLPILSNISQLVTQWKSSLDPLLANILTQGRFISNVTLVASTPLTINHKLGARMNGYIICGQDASANIWFTKPFNQLTLTLESSDDVTLSLWVF